MEEKADKPIVWSHVSLSTSRLSNKSILLVSKRVQGECMTAVDNGSRVFTLKDDQTLLDLLPQTHPLDLKTINHHHRHFKNKHC